MTQHRPLVLIILDGWGHREDPTANAIAKAKTPCFDHVWQQFPHTVIEGCGNAVGLPEGQMGNSEVGHLNMGAGRIVYQDLTRIDQAIKNGEFFTNPVLVNTIINCQKNNTALHILGLLSPGGVHSHEAQIHALIQLAAQKQCQKVYVHAFLDGRDTPPQSAIASLEKITTLGQSLGTGQIATIIGRFYAMDRDNRWERIEKTYDLLTLNKADYYAPDAITAIELAYQRGETDEFVKPTAILPVTINDNDAIIFMNFRADRAREITGAFIDDNFTGFVRQKRPALSAFVSLTEYNNAWQIPIAYPPERLTNILSDYVSKLGLKQLRIAETEKYAHVTFFFNGGIEQAFPGEDRILIPSPKVATYDLKPEMSAPEMTERLVQAILQQHYDIIICNFANPDMVGHTGNLTAAIKAIETVDQCLSKIVAALQSVGGEAIITSDHGNAEIMFDSQTNQPHTAHTLEKIPFIYLGRPATINKKHGTLADIAPTMLYLLGLPKPKEMTGETLVKTPPYGPNSQHLDY